MGLFTMGKTVIKQLFGKSPNLMYPVKPAKKMDTSRGHITFDGSKCISCRLCQKKCPATAITVDPKAKTWQIDRFRCIVCNSCVEACPSKIILMDTQYMHPFTSRENTVETYPITWVKPAKPAADKAPEAAEG